MKKFRTAALIPIMMTALAGSAFAAEATPSAYAEKFGFITLLPAIITLVLAFFTKNVIFSLLMGILSGGYLLSIKGINILSSIAGSFNLSTGEIVQQFTIERNAGIILQCLMITGLVALITRNGGTQALARKISGIAKTPALAQISAFFMGIIVFMDDYATALISGPVMRPITDRMKVSREKLAFIIDATAAPVAGLALVSTWLAYELSIIKEAYTQLGLDINPYSVFLNTLPYRFYSILIIALVIFTALTRREFGPMLKAEARSRGEGKVLADNARPLVFPSKAYAEPENIRRGSKIALNAVIPLLTLILYAFFGFYISGRQQIISTAEETMVSSVISNPVSADTLRNILAHANAPMVLFQAAFLACVVAAAMGVSQRRFNISGAVDTWLAGIRSNMNTVIVLILSWSLASIMTKLGAALYAASYLKSNIPDELIPAAVFIITALAAFVCSNAFAAMGIIMPIAVSFSVAATGSVDQIPLVMAAVLTGCVFGINCSPMADITLLSSMGAMSDHLHHVRTQLPYALLSGAIAVFAGFIPMGYGVSAYIALPLCLILLFVILMIFGRVPEHVADGVYAARRNGVNINEAGRSRPIGKVISSAVRQFIAFPSKIARFLKNLNKHMKKTTANVEFKKQRKGIKKKEKTERQRKNNSTPKPKRKIEILTYDFKSNNDYDEKSSHGENTAISSNLPTEEQNEDAPAIKEKRKKEDLSEFAKDIGAEELQLELFDLVPSEEKRKSDFKEEKQSIEGWPKGSELKGSELDEILKQLEEMDRPRRTFRSDSSGSNYDTKK